MNSRPNRPANSNSTEHPALESIAAYLDGRLPESDRPALAGHLDSCAACYEIYVESLRFQTEESQEARRTVLPFERAQRTGQGTGRLARGFRTWALPIAALLVVGVGYAVWHQLHLPLQPRPIESFTASLGIPGPLLDKLGPFDVSRGGEDDSTNYPVVAFQSGATLVDLRLAIEAKDAERIEQFAQSLGVLFYHGSTFSPPTEIAEVQAIVARFREGKPSPTVWLTDFHGLERILRDTNEGEILSPHYELGVWTEAGRLAVYGGRSEFFSNPKNRKSLRWFRRHPPQERPEVKTALTQIEDAWPEGPLTPSSQVPLASGFGQVIDSYDVPLTSD